ncbi:MAG: HypC/HybG/HupF family hydrogenase formation chaperone [Candidatus Aenigmatarchaeota archaeon]|nr:MAG: HypC/HybG/HupF family hydrogenase formation chaperone [Candidatus Aenigmarchaeota archaeon]
MCISKPQRVLSFKDGKALVEFGGEKKRVKSPFPLNKGEFVLCQAGFVVKKIPEKVAKDMLKEWKEMNEWI